MFWVSRYKIVAIGLLIVLVSSCSPGKKLAKEFIKSGDTIHVLFMNPDDAVFLKQNLSPADQNSGKTGSDSASINASIFLDVIEEKTVTDMVYSNMESVMKCAPFRVYEGEELSRFMQLGVLSYIIRMAQVELDESITPFTASEQFDSLLYTEEFSLNTVSVNMWMEVTEVNGQQDTSQVLFSNMQVQDAVDGYFRKNFSGMVEYVYQRNDIKLEDINVMTARFGEMNAHYLYDYFLNKYIHENYKGEKPLKYYHYDGSTGTLYPAGYNRFVFM